MMQSIHGTGKCVIMDSGFCVLEAILQLIRVGVWATYSDKSFDVRQMIDVWDENMKDYFVPYFVPLLRYKPCL